MNCGKLSDLSWVSGEPRAAMEFSRETVGNSRILVNLEPANRRYRMRYASSLLDYGYTLRKIEGNTPDALVNVRQALGLLESLHSADGEDQKLARTLSLGYSRAAEILGSEPAHYAEALEMDEKASALVRSMASLAPHNADLAHLVAFSDLDIGTLLTKMHRWDDAREHDERALAQFKELRAGEPKAIEYRIDVALALADLGKIELLRGHADRAATILEDSLRETVLAPGDGAANVHFLTARAGHEALLGQAYAVLAKEPHRSASQRADAWQSARRHYQHALDSFSGLKGSSPDVAEQIHQVTDAIAQCDVALARG